MEISKNTAETGLVGSINTSNNRRRLIEKNLYLLGLGIEALAGLELMSSNAIDQDIGVTGEQLAALIKCVGFSLSTSQKILAELNAKQSND